MWAASRHPLLWLRVRWSHWSVDAQLAAGLDPASDRALLLRAGELQSPRHRRLLAKSVERLAGDATAARAPGLTSAVPLVCEQVGEARDSLLVLADLLRRAERVRPRGIAMVQRLLTDGGSVLYTETARGAVELQVQAAIGQLVAEPLMTGTAPRMSPAPRREAPPRLPPRDVRA